MPYRSTHIRDVECAACKQPFRPYNTRQLTCSPECARRRKTEKQSAARKDAEQRRLAEAADWYRKRHAK